jgi:flagellar biosynthesis protein FlhG
MPSTAPPAERRGESAEVGPRRRRQLIAIGGGRGGVGKTLLSVNLAVYLAQLGRNVLLVDAEPSSSNLHAGLGLSRPPMATPLAIREGRAAPVPTSVPGLTLLPTAYDVWAVAPRRASRKSQWMVPIDRLPDIDYVVINVGASTAAASLDVFQDADVGICVAMPEPAAVEATYRFCRALYARHLKRTVMRDGFRVKILERAIASLHPLPSPRELVAEVARYDEPLANVAAASLQRLRPGLVIGLARLRRDYDLGQSMSMLSERYLGMGLDYMGYIEHDDAVWLTARRRRPLLIDAPTSKAARNIERVARRLLALLAQPTKSAEDLLLDAKGLNAPRTLYDVLGIDRTATDDEVRRAYKLQREIFREDSLPIVSLLDAEQLGTQLGRISEAYDTLLDQQRRRAYDMSVFPKDEPDKVDSLRRRPSASEAELAQLQADLAREITPETQFTGQLLRKAREAYGIEIQEIAGITKISPMYLRAIEAEDVEALPAPVYVRGFLQQIAKALRLDPMQVTRTYLKRMRAAQPSYE